MSLLLLFPTAASVRGTSGGDSVFSDVTAKGGGGGVDSWFSNGADGGDGVVIVRYSI